MDARGLGYSLWPGGCLTAGPCQGYNVGVARILPEAMMLSRPGLLPRAMSGSMALQ